MKICLKGVRGIYYSTRQWSNCAGLVEALGALVVVIPGETTNVKITHLGDLEVLGARSQS